jgi:hypothetical protein
VYNAYNIPIQNVSLLFETQDLGHLSKHWMPKFLLRFTYKRFIEKYNEWFSDKSVSSVINDSLYILRLKNKIENILPLIHTILKITPDSKLANEGFEEEFGRKYKGENDLKLIENKIENLQLKLPKEAIVNNKGISFSTLISLVESSRGIGIDRNITLYDFKNIYEIEREKWQKSSK